MAEQQADTGERVALSCNAEYTVYPRSKQVCWATASLKAPFYEPAARAPVDIVAVIDKSGSMGGAKLDLVKKTLLFIVDQCKSQAFVHYSSHAAWEGTLASPNMEHFSLTQ